MKKLTEEFKKEIKDTTESRLKMYKRDFCLDLDSEVVIDMESKYIIALLENVDIEKYSLQQKEVK